MMATHIIGADAVDLSGSNCIHNKSDNVRSWLFFVCSKPPFYFFQKNAYFIRQTIIEKEEMQYGVKVQTAECGRD